MHEEWLHKWATDWEGLMVIKKCDWKLACGLPLVEEKGKWCCMLFSSCLITFCHNYSKCNHSPLLMHNNLLFPWELWADGCWPITNTCISLHKLMSRFFTNLLWKYWKSLQAKTSDSKFFNSPLLIWNIIKANTLLNKYNLPWCFWQSRSQHFGHICTGCVIDKPV